MRSTKIYIGNLPESSSAEELQEMFEKYGDVKECDIVKNYGFVHMSSEEEAKAAIEGLNNAEFMGSKISVEMSHSKVRQRPGMGGKGQCYRCGRQGHWSKECPRNPVGSSASYSEVGLTSRTSWLENYWMRASRMSNSGPPMYPSTYNDRFPRFSMERPYGVERPFTEQRGFVDRMRPYPDPYERRPPMTTPQDNFMYYRRPYETYSYTRRSPPPQAPPSRYDFTQDPPHSHLIEEQMCFSSPESTSVPQPDVLSGELQATAAPLVSRSRVFLLASPQDKETSSTP